MIRGVPQFIKTLAIVGGSLRPGLSLRGVSKSCTNACSRNGAHGVEGNMRKNNFREGIEGRNDLEQRVIGGRRRRRDMKPCGCIGFLPCDRTTPSRDEEALAG